MKTEDIDKRIGMPDVDKEWARFEQEVIDPHQQPPSMGRLSAAKNSPPRGRWRGVGGLLGIGIAASVALLLIFNIGKQQTEQTPHIAKTEEIKPQPTPLPVREEVQQVKEQEVVTKTPIPVIAPRKELALAKADAPATTGLDIPAREYTGAVQKFKMDDIEDLAFESVDQALQGQIAGQDISHNEAEPELQGVIAGHEGIDPTYNDSILVLLDGKRLPDSLCTRQFARRGIHKYLEKKGLLVDKIVRLNEESVRIKGDEQTKQRYKQYVEQYGRLAQLGVAEITSANDSANEVFVLQHPELKKTFRRVEGFVMEESTNEPLESTIIRHRQFATSADPLGHFVLWVPKSVDTLYAKCIGCQDAFFQPADTTLTIRLKDNYRSHDIASADLSSGTTMRLRGLGDSVIDQIGKTDSFLVVVNGKTLFDSRGMTSEEIEKRIDKYLKEQGLLQDIKIPCNNGAIVIMASTPEEREELQRMIANATIVPTSADLGNPNTLRLRGTGNNRPSDKDRIDSTLILVNGEPLPDSLKQRIMGNDMDDIDTYMPRYFSQQGLMIDSVYVLKDSEFTEKYGGRAKYGVIEITTMPDTYCDAYVRKHPKLKKKYHRIEGYVMNNEDKPLTEAWVHVKRERALLKEHPELGLVGAATDSTGHYVLWLPKDIDITLCAEQTGYKSFEFSPSDKNLVMQLETDASMRLRGNPVPTPELQGVIAGLPDAPPNDSILYIVNGVPQPKENNKWLGKMSYLDYFKRQHLLVDSVKRNMNEEAKQRYLERFGMAAKHGVVEYFCVEDTLCDYYMNQHEELKASRRRVSGVVLDENDEPLDHTIIHILQFEPEKKIWGFETTDSLGNFAFWVPRTGVKMNFKYIGYKAVVVEPSDKTLVMHLEPSASMRLRGNPEPTSELQGQIAGLPPIDIRRVKNDYRRTVNKQAPDTTLTLVNGKEDEAFLPYLWKNPYWSRTFIYDYFFERNQLFIRQYRPEGDEINKYAHLFNGRDIRFILDYQSMPYKPVGQFTPDELKARRLAYLLRCYREGKNDQDNHGMLAPDLFDTPAEERLFGLLGVKYRQGNRFEKFGHVSRDSRGTYIPLERHMQFKVQDQIWEENGEWLGMEDDERFNAVIKELDEAANGASSSLVEPGDSVVAMAFIYGGKVAKGALHESDVMWEKPFKDKVKGSIFEFTPDEDAPSYWTAEIYYSTQFPRYMVVYLNSVDKLYATECPDILNIRYKRLSGVVEDEDGKPVGHATIGFRDRPYFSDGVSADSLGRFELMLPNHIDTIRASWINYQTQKIRVLPTDSVLTIRLKKIDWERLRKSEEKSLSSWKILLNSVSLQHKKKASEE